MVGKTQELKLTCTAHEKQKKKKNEIYSFASERAGHHLVRSSEGLDTHTQGKGKTDPSIMRDQDLDYMLNPQADEKIQTLEWYKYKNGDLQKGSNSA